jgi:hypothetical protein
VNIYASPNSSGGSIAVDQKGSLFVSGTFCGTDTNSASVNGVARVNADGSLTLVAGGGGGLSNIGLSALAVNLAEAPAIAFDTPAPGQTQNLYLSVPAGNYVARVDGATHRLDQIAGTGASGSSGSFGAATSATFNLPLAIALRPGTRDLYLAEGTTYGVGMVAGANPTAVTSASFAMGTPVSVYPDQGQSLAAQIKDGAGGGLAGRAVTFALDPSRLAGGYLSPSRTLTDGAGVGIITAGVGLALGTYGVVASASDLHGTPLSGSPVSLSFSAVAPPAGLVFSAVDQSHTSGTVPAGPTPGATVKITGPRAATVASDGTVYFSDSYNQIYKMQPSGLVTILVPTPSNFQPWGLTLDESKSLLYWADAATTGYVRAVNVVNGSLSLVAGASSGGNADGPATGTTLGNPSRVRFLGGKIYVSDRSNLPGSRLRRIDPAAVPPTIETFIPELSSTALPAAPALQANCTTAYPLVFSYCGSDPGCSVAAAPPADGRLYVSGRFCGSQVNGGNIPAIVRVELNGSLVLVGTASVLDSEPAITTDAAGNLYMAKPGGGSPRFGYYAADANGVVGPSSVFRPLAQGTIGAEYTDQSFTAFSIPYDVAFGGHIWVADYGLPALRVLW